MKKARIFDPSIYLFQSVLDRTWAGFSTMVKQELLNLPNDFLNKFRSFPRSLPEYSSLISTLSSIASVSVPSVIKLLVETLIGIIRNQQRNLSLILNYAIEYDRDNKAHRQFLLYVEIIFLTDLISTIVSNYNQISSEDDILLQLGYILASISLGQPLMYEVVLPQYASVINRISKRNFKKVYESFSQLIINKPEPYFVLLKYTTLDDSELSIDFLGVLYDYVNREKRKKVLSHEMLSSLATLLASYHQDMNDPIINDFLVFAQNIMKNKDFSPSLKYGALQILSVLKAKSNYTNINELKEYYEQNIVPILDTKEGFYCALKCYYFLVFSNYIESEKMFNSWSPKTNESEGFVPLLTITNEKKKEEIMEMSCIFRDYLDHSSYDYDSQMQTIFRHLLLHFAQLDLKFFMDTIEPHFLEADNDDKFTIFLSCVSAINSDKFMTDETVLNTFNTKLSHLTYQRLYKVSNDMKDLRFYGHKSGESTYVVENAEEKIRLTLEKWDLSFDIDMWNRSDI